MNPDTLFILKDMNSTDINWTQIIIQSSIITVLFGIISLIVRTRFEKKLESLRNEFSIIQTTFSNNYSFVLDYYSNFYKHYRACQKVVEANDVIYPDKTVKNTEDIFLDNLDKFVTKLNEVEPTIRLIFPEYLMSTHNKSIAAFNAFRHLIKSYYDFNIQKPEGDLVTSFEKIDEIKEELERGCRKYLRTEKIIVE